MIRRPGIELVSNEYFDKIQYRENVFHNELFLSVYWTLDVSRKASYEVTFVRLSVRLSLCPSVTKCSENWIISFFDFLHDDS